jgi:hypothetical protein
MARRKLTVEKDQEAEDLSGLVLKAASAFFDAGEKKLTALGEVQTMDGESIDSYREVQLIVYDADGDIIGRNYTNWSDFGIRQSFSLVLDEDDLFGEPARVKLYPSS